MKIKGFFSIFVLFLCIIVSFLFTACGESEDLFPTGPTKPDTTSESGLDAKWKVLKEFTLEELKEVEKKLGLGNIFINKPEYAGDVQMMAVKVSCKSFHPNGSGKKINLSGVVLMPPPVDSSRLHRLIIAPPYTYVLNRQAPTNQLSNYNASQLEAHLAFWTLQAFKGNIVLIPDYPGFGDSHGQCFVPYTESQSMVRSTEDWLDAALMALKDYSYQLKDECIITGYSLGGFVAASLTRKIETDPKSTYRVSLLFTGGTPCRLKQISDLVRSSEELATSYLMPYAIWGYKKNSYPEISVNHILKEPYASESDAYFDGLHENIGGLFPKKVKELFSDTYILDLNGSNQRIHEILEENSLKPWENKCNFIMVHGVSDKTVYYENAKDYSIEHNQLGGNVRFINTFGDHSGAGISYFIQLILLLPAYI